MESILKSQFGNLTVVSDEINIKMTKGGRKLRYLLCVCVCGVEKLFLIDHLRSGHTKSCGCNKPKVLKDSATTHGFSKTRAYKCYYNMLKRCYNVNCDKYSYYGGRGITVCDRWREGSSGFLNFLEDLGECPKMYTLDRIDPDGNYEPGNCRWASKSTQSFNKRKVADSLRTGVKYYASFDKYIAHIGFNYEKIYLGSFEFIDDAIKAREAAELKYFGEVLKQ